MIAVRSASPADAPSWLRMREALWPEAGVGEHAGEVDAYFAGGLKEPLEVLLAVRPDGATVGFAELSIRSHAEDCVTDRVAYLEGWYVDQDARRQGVGRALVDAAEKWALAQGCVEFGSDALLDNAVSRVAHLALGFEETEQIRCFKKLLRPVPTARTPARLPAPSGEGAVVNNRSIPSSTVIPVLAYADVRAAVDWLCRSFGFVERLRIADHRAQLTFGSGAIVASAGSTASPSGHSLLVRVDDVDGHCERAKLAGARIIAPPVDQPYGERQYTAEDIGGHRWTFSQSIADADPKDWGGVLFD